MKSSPSGGAVPKGLRGAGDGHNPDMFFEPPPPPQPLRGSSPKGGALGPSIRKSPEGSPDFPSHR